MKIVIATIKSWNIEYARELQNHYKELCETTVITNKEELEAFDLERFSPDYVFFPHWSYKIPAEIYEKYHCVVFHMTDLPFGRGGSPLQNLIVRGYQETKISAIKVVEEMDAGPVYLKKQLTLEGTAEEIFRRASKIIFTEMIPQIIKEKMVPVPQEGEIVTFKRRKPEESEIKEDFTIEKIYDYIRMLDAEGYPKAFIQFGDYKLELSDAVPKDGELQASVTIRRGQNE